jgi:hypothetical protein
MRKRTDRNKSNNRRQKNNRRNNRREYGKETERIQQETGGAP